MTDSNQHSELMKIVRYGIGPASISDTPQYRQRVADALTALANLEEQLEAAQKIIDAARELVGDDAPCDAGFLCDCGTEAYNGPRRANALRAALAELHAANDQDPTSDKTPRGLPSRVAGRAAAASSPSSGERVATGEPSRTSAQGAKQSPEESSPTSSPPIIPGPMPGHHVPIQSEEWEGVNPLTGESFPATGNLKSNDEVQGSGDETSNPASSRYGHEMGTPVDLSGRPFEPFPASEPAGDAS